MKRIPMVALLLVVYTNLFAQTILEYFPVKTGNTWTYTNGNEKLNETWFIQNTAERDIPLYLMVKQIAGIGQTSTMYGLENNKIVAVVERNISGNYSENRRPFPVTLALPEQSWRQNDDGEYYLFASAKSQITYDDKYFSDCILIKQEIYVGNNLFMTKRSYFAKNIGLVYVTTQGVNENETCFMKLKECNFTSLTSNKNNTSVDNIATVTGLFFRQLARGIDSLPYTAVLIMERLENDEQKTIFYAMLNALISYLDSYSEMLEAGSVRIKTFINEPIPDGLLFSGIEMVNTPFNEIIATAVHRALKVIVLSCQLQTLNSKRNLTIDDKDLVSGTESAEKKLYQLFTNDPGKSADYYEAIDIIYNTIIKSYLENGGK